MEPSKVCTKCGREKPLSEFGKQTRNKDGLSYHCRLCRRIYNKRWRDLNRDKEKERAFIAYRKNAEKIKARRRERYAENPQQGLAHRMRGPSQPCIVCGAKADAHHDDYSKPTEVTWLCRKHHMNLHFGKC